MFKPTTPDLALRRVRTLSRLNGWSVAFFAGGCTIIVALSGDWTGIIVGILVVASGAMEIMGNRMLIRRDSGGMRWLVCAQLVLLGVILVYASTRILTVEQGLAVEDLSPVVRDAVNQLGLDQDELRLFLRPFVWAFYGSVMLASCIYQGGLACYYRLRSGLVAQALAVPPLLKSGPARLTQ